VREAKRCQQEGWTAKLRGVCKRRIALVLTWHFLQEENSRSAGR